MDGEGPSKKRLTDKQLTRNSCEEEEDVDVVRLFFTFCSTQNLFV